MKRRLISVIAFALLAAVGASTVLYQIIATSNGSGKVRAATMKIPVAAHDLETGTVLAATDIVEAEWPATVGSEWIQKRQDIVGRAVTSTIAKDEPFSVRRIAEKGAGNAFAVKIPAGMRAVTVHVDELTGFSRFITAGMHVDVISTPSGGQGGARTILQNVTVFSMGETVERNQKDRPVTAQSVNLLVTPQQAEVLSQAVAQTRIELILRNPLDTGSFLPSLTASAPKPAAAGDVVRPKVARAPVAPAPKPVPAPEPAKPVLPTIEVIHGTKKAITTVGSADTQEEK